MHVRYITRVARQLRRDSTPAERELWQYLRAGRLDGLKFRRQHPRGGVIHDFFCQGARLVVELDGDHHRSAFRQYANDRARDQLTADDGYTVLRLANNEVFEDLPSVLAKIRAAATACLFIEGELDEPAPTSSMPAPLSRKGEGPGDR